MEWATYFEVRNSNPKFLCRFGPAHEQVALPFNKKLCFTATDRELLACQLYALSLRADCYFTKFSTQARGGMFLGRCFLTSADAVGSVWAEYRYHPKLFCTVQDDDFVEPYRELGETFERRWVDTDEPTLAADAHAGRC